MSVTPGILVATPDHGINRLLRRTFEASGYSVTMAGTGAAAIVAIERTEPHLVILSADFADLSGDELIGLVRGSSKASIIALFYPN